MLNPGVGWVAIVLLSAMSSSAFSQNSQYSTDYSHLYDIDQKTFLIDQPWQNATPSSLAECKAITDKMQEQSDGLNTAHEDCLDRHRKAHDPGRHVQNTDTTCDFAGCQSLHTAKNDANSALKLANQYADECRQAYHDAQEAKRNREEEDQRRKAEHEAERNEQQVADAKKQAKANRPQQKQQSQDDTDSRADARRDAEDRARAQAKADAENRKFAAEESQRRQQALAQRTDQRQQQLAQVDADGAVAMNQAAVDLGTVNAQIAGMDSRLNSTADATGTGNLIVAGDDYGEAPVVAPAPVPSADLVQDIWVSQTANDHGESLITPSDPATRSAYLDSNDTPEARKAISALETDMNEPDPPANLINNLKDGLNQIIDATKEKYQQAKATLSGLMNSPMAQTAMEEHEMLHLEAPLPNATDSDEARVNKVFLTVQIGLVKFAADPTPRALRDFLSRNVDAIGADLGLATNGSADGGADANYTK